MSLQLDSATTTCFKGFWMSSFDLVFPSFCMTQSKILSAFSDPSLNFSKKQKMLRLLGSPGALYWSSPAKMDTIVPCPKLTSWQPMASNCSMCSWSDRAAESWLKRFCKNLGCRWPFLCRPWRPPWEIVSLLKDVIFPCCLFAFCLFQLFFCTLIWRSCWIPLCCRPGLLC